MTLSVAKITWAWKCFTRSPKRRQDASVAVIGVIERHREIDDRRIEGLRFHRGDARTVVADRDLRHAVMPQPLLPRHLVGDPARDRADGGDADLLAFEIVDRIDAAVVAHHEREDQRRPGHGGDAFDRRALDDEGEARTRSQADIDAIGGHRLLHLGVTAEARNVEIEAVVLEDAGLSCRLRPARRRRRSGRLCRRAACRHRPWPAARAQPRSG